MTLRINTNIAALNSVRNLEDTDRKLAESLQRLSSGFKINKGADNPAGLVISEQLRGQIVGINQAISNSEMATSIVQTGEAALSEVNNLLIRMRQLALQANNEGANDSTTLAANQLEIDDALRTINQVAQNTQFGNRKLLDGSGGVTGEALGGGLTFISGGVNTRTSPLEGYVVEIEQIPTRSFLEGSSAMDQDDLADLQLTLFEGGRTVQVTARETDTPASFFGRLRRASEEAGLQLDLSMDDEAITVVHRKFGSANTFQASSSQDGILSDEAGKLQAAVPGQDVAGTIHGEVASGSGQLLRGLPGNETTQDLVVRYAGPRVMVDDEGPDGLPVFRREPDTGIAGVVNVSNNALQFQTGPNHGQQILVALPQINAGFLARDVENESNFHNLSEIRVDTQQGSRDSIRLVDSAIDNLTLVRGRLGALQKNGLESNIATLRVTAENLMAAESVVRDADLAKELAEFTKNKLLLETGAAALAQAIQLPSKVISLIT